MVVGCGLWVVGCVLRVAVSCHAVGCVVRVRCLFGFAYLSVSGWLLVMGCLLFCVCCLLCSVWCLVCVVCCCCLFVVLCWSLFFVCCVLSVARV